MSSRTSVFEMRAMAGHRHDEKLTPARVERFPHRDIDRLQDALEASETVHEVARTLDCQPQDVYRWASIYGLDVDARLVGGESDV